MHASVEDWTYGYVSDGQRERSRRVVADVDAELRRVRNTAMAAHAPHPGGVTPGAGSIATVIALPKKIRNRRRPGDLRIRLFDRPRRHHHDLPLGRK